MVTSKTMLCRCEDITLDDCREAIHGGYEAFEDLKRYLGVGTGPCQGKACVQACMQVVASERGIPIGDVDVMTFRPPVRPIPFATLAADDAAHAADDTHEPQRTQSPQTQSPRFPSSASSVASSSGSDAP